MNELDRKAASPMDAASVDAPQEARLSADALQALYDDHMQDSCEYEMGSCVSGCRPGECKPWCISDDHALDASAPEWPCDVILTAEGLTREQFWQREDDRLDAHMRQWATENGVTYP